MGLVETGGWIPALSKAPSSVTSRLLPAMVHSVSHTYPPSHLTPSSVTLCPLSLSMPTPLPLCDCFFLVFPLALCAMSTQATGVSSTLWSVRGTVETISAGRTGAPTARPPKSSPSAGSSTESHGIRKPGVGLNRREGKK